jgi:L-seryl-tRNA(Ser) seleniumtransferase
MIRESAAGIRARAEKLAAQLEGVKAEIVAGESVIGGGSTPDQSLPTWLIAIASPDVVAVERALRSCDPPVVARIEENRLLVDLRTVLPEEEAALVSAVISAYGGRHK